MIIPQIGPDYFFKSRCLVVLSRFSLKNVSLEILLRNQNHVAGVTRATPFYSTVD